jgi:hypothetical protein
MKPLVRPRYAVQAINQNKEVTMKELKSKMVTIADYLTEKEKSNYTELQVLRSNAGWYVGTMYEEKDKDGNVVWSEPGSRDTDYFKSREDAERYLRIMQKGFNLPVREHPAEPSKGQKP